MWDSKPVRLYSAALRFSPPEEEDRSHHCAAKSDQPKNLLSCGESSCHPLDLLALACLLHPSHAGCFALYLSRRAFHSSRGKGRREREAQAHYASRECFHDRLRHGVYRPRFNILSCLTSTRNAAPARKITHD